MRGLLRWIDMPPLWLALFAVAAWGQAQLLSAPVAAGRLAGGVLIAAGVLIGTVAVVQFLARHTTVIPRETPSTLVRGGIYRLTRNPIYLGDALVLAGLALYWGAYPSLLLVPAFMYLIQKRFILGEEAHIRTKFGGAYDDYTARVRRWL